MEDKQWNFKCCVRIILLLHQYIFRSQFKNVLRWSWNRSYNAWNLCCKHANNSTNNKLTFGYLKCSNEHMLNFRILRFSYMQNSVYLSNFMFLSIPKVVVGFDCEFCDQSVNVYENKQFFISYIAESLEDALSMT